MWIKQEEWKDGLSIYLSLERAHGDEARRMRGELLNLSVFGSSACGELLKQAECGASACGWEEWGGGGEDNTQVLQVLPLEEPRLAMVGQNTASSLHMKTWSQKRRIKRPQFFKLVREDCTITSTSRNNLATSAVNCHNQQEQSATSAANHHNQQEPIST